MNIGSIASRYASRDASRDDDLLDDDQMSSGGGVLGGFTQPTQNALRSPWSRRRPAARPINMTRQIRPGFNVAAATSNYIGRLQSSPMYAAALRKAQEQEYHAQRGHRMDGGGIREPDVRQRLDYFDDPRRIARSVATSALTDPRNDGNFLYDPKSALNQDEWWNDPASIRSFRDAYGQSIAAQGGAGGLGGASTGVSRPAATPIPQGSVRFNYFR